MLFSERPPIYASCMTISGRRTKQLDIITGFCCVTGFTSDFRPPIYASCMTISGGRTEQRVLIGFGELAAVDYNM